MAKVLVAEDEPGIALGLEDTLRLEGYQVEVVTTGTTASRRALEERFDLILLDVMLPGKSGFDVCRELRQSGLEAPIIFLTARTDGASPRPAAICGDQPAGSKTARRRNRRGVSGAAAAVSFFKAARRRRGLRRNVPSGVGSQRRLLRFLQAAFRLFSPVAGRRLRKRNAGRARGRIASSGRPRICARDRPKLRRVA